jgi:hypothetical protein
MAVYVDDFLIMTPDGKMREGLIAKMKETWQMRDEVVLDETGDLTFLGLELKKVKGGISLSQSRFVDMLLTKYGMEKANGTMAVNMDAPPADLDVPTAEHLKRLQGFAGEFNWLATRTRADLSYFVSLLASALTKQAAWSDALAKKILRYLAGTRDACLWLDRRATKPSLEVGPTPGSQGSVRSPRAASLSPGLEHPAFGVRPGKPFLRFQLQKRSLLLVRWRGLSWRVCACFWRNGG